MTTLRTAQLFALEPSGPRPVPVAAGQGSLQDFVDKLPLGVYSALRTFDHNRFLWLEEHLDRTDRSMALSGWDLRLDRSGLRSALHAVTTDAPFPDSRVRFDVLRESASGLETDSRVLIALSPFTPIPERLLREGVRVELTASLRRDRPRIKTADFTLRRRPYPLERQEAFEHVMVDEAGSLLEGTSSNFHAVRGREIFAAGEGVLEGITAKIVARLAAALGLSVRPQPIASGDLATIDEAFLTSSVRGIVPIVAVGERSIGAGKPGPVTQRLLADYYAFAQREARTAI